MEEPTGEPLLVLFGIMAGSTPHRTKRPPSTIRTDPVM
jgi:hypothetical protein